jgi:hypothetical protein
MTKKEFNTAVLALAASAAVTILFGLFLGWYGFFLSACCTVGGVISASDENF